MLCHENQGVTDLPPLQESRPRDSQTRRGKEYENWIRGSLQVLMLLLLPCGAPLNIDALDGAASCMTFCLTQVADCLSDRSGRAGGRWLDDRCPCKDRAS